MRILQLQGSLEARAKANGPLDSNAIRQVIESTLSPRDPWQRPWQVIVDNGRFRVFSSGENGVPGDWDDIAVSETATQCPYDSGQVTQDGWLPAHRSRHDEVIGLPQSLGILAALAVCVGVGAAIWEVRHRP